MFIKRFYIKGKNWVMVGRRARPIIRIKKMSILNDEAIFVFFEITSQNQKLLRGFSFLRSNSLTL